MLVGDAAAVAVLVAVSVAVAVAVGVAGSAVLVAVTTGVSGTGVCDAPPHPNSTVSVGRPLACSRLLALTVSGLFGIKARGIAPFPLTPAVTSHAYGAPRPHAVPPGAASPPVAGRVAQVMPLSVHAPVTSRTSGALAVSEPW